MEFDKVDIADSSHDIQLKGEDLLEKWQADLLILDQQKDKILNLIVDNHCLLQIISDFKKELKASRS